MECESTAQRRRRLARERQRKHRAGQNATDNNDIGQRRKLARERQQKLRSSQNATDADEIERRRRLARERQQRHRASKNVTDANEIERRRRLARERQQRHRARQNAVDANEIERRRRLARERQQRHRASQNAEEVERRRRLNRIRMRNCRQNRLVTVDNNTFNENGKCIMASGNRGFQILTKNRLLTGFEKEKEGLWKGPFSFIQAADTQFGMIEDYIEKRENPGWQEEIVLTEKAIKAVNQMVPKPRFFIVCGDLINAFPGTTLRKPQEIDFKKVFSDLDPEIPLICVCGNHDIGDTPTPDSIITYKNTFGDDYFSFWCGGMMCIVLNSQYFQDPSLVLDNAKEQEIWLEEQLSLAKSGAFQHVVVFQHIPWFLFKPDEKKEYFNIDKDLRIKMLKKFQEAGIKIIFCGHYHRNAGGFYENVEVVTTSAIGAQLGTDKSGMRIVRVLPETIKHDYYALEDLPTEINLTNL